MDVSEGSSSAPGIYDYDVYLSFRGPECRHLAEILFDRFENAGVRVFRDEDIRIGEDISYSLLEAIKRSRISIPVFSEGYASSKWCLEEVVQMLECREIQGQRIFPIYYCIYPSDIRNQTGAFEKSFTENERRGIDPGRIEIWKQALRKVASLKGWEFDRWFRHKHIELVVSHVCQSLKEDISSTTMDISGGSSLVEGIYDFDVFLNFESYAGSGFADLLYNRLKDAGVLVFRVDHVPEGEEIAGFVFKAIKRSRISIPVFSKDYAWSRWCLDEVVQMLECRESQGHRIFPIYHLIDPHDIKNQTGPFEKAFKEYEKSGIDPGRIETWKRALHDVACLSGWHVDDNFKRYSKSIVSAILNKLKEEHPGVVVRMQDQVEKLKKVLDVESQNVLFVGIHGIGGIGKTTLARTVFDQLSTHFEGCSFLRDIRETSRHKGLKYLEDQLLRDITCADADYETKTRRHIFLEKKVLIVLDDVDERGQIKKLVGKSNRFVSGSRIIVTTRDVNVLAVERETLDGHILEWPEEVRSYKMEKMKSAEALQLFCRHAFGKVCPPDDYRSKCKKVISAIGKLPLALEIIGSYLNHKPEDVWKETLEKLKNPPHRDLHTNLTISYEALDNGTKELFLDIACFFTGQEKTTPIYMWDACGLFPELGIEALSSMSLVKILGDNRLWMHDEVRDFGRKIACGAIVDSAKASRLWANEEVLDILRSKEVNKNVQGLRLHFDEFLRDCTFPPEKLGALPQLRFLELLGFPFAMKRDLPKLRWLSWHFSPEHIKASDLYLENLVILDLSNSNVSDRLGEPGQLEMAKHLKVLDLTNCKEITRTPIFSECMILERLILEGCEKLVKIDSSIGNLKQLIYLNLKGCYSLEGMPKELGSATALTELIMKGNGQSFKLQESLIGLTSLSVLEIYNVKIVDPIHIGNSKRLERLILSECSGIRKLTESGQFFSLLVKLDVSGSEITKLPDSIGEMKNLKVIKMESSLVSELPKSIGNLKKLEELHAKECRGLHGEIPSEIGTLSSLGILDLSFTEISSLPSTLSQLSNLQTLNLECCNELEKLPELPKSLIRLHVICKKLQSLPDLPEMNSLRDLQFSCALDEFQANWFGKLSRLETLELCIPRINVLKLGETSQLKSLSVSCKDMETLPQLPLTLSKLCLSGLKKGTNLPSLCNLKSLTFIDFYNCSIGDDEFRSLGAVKLNLLEHFSASKCDFSSCNGLPLPERLRVFSLRECELPSLLALQTLKNLMHLELIDCQQLTEVTGLEKLESLEEIIICNCNFLETLGDLSDLAKLEALQIDSCKMLREVRGLERMKSLKHLLICCCELLGSFPGRLKLKKRHGQSLTDPAPIEKKLHTD